MEELTRENQKLKEVSLNGRAEFLMNTTGNNKTSLGKFNNLSTVNQMTEPNATNSNQFLDLKQIKKIEPKRPEKNSTHATKNLPPNNDYVKIDNLNAKTAEIMKNSPGVGNNYQNQSFSGMTNNNTNFNQRALINVNINSSNRIDKNEISNYEKGLFRTYQGQMGNNQNNQSLSNSTVNNSMNSYNSTNVNNPYYHNQKRKYLEMANSSNIHQIQNNQNSAMAGGHFQTPMNNTGMSLNDMYRNKKMKLN